MNPAGLISVGLIGAGRMGSFHAETLARRLPGTRLAPIANCARTGRTPTENKP